MNGAGGITPWPRVEGTTTTPSVTRVTRRELDERMMLARLFGRSEPTGPPAPKPEAANDVRDDEFASNLGRHVDLTA